MTDTAEPDESAAQRDVDRSEAHSRATADRPETEPGLRADAERNRESILAAARRLYAREGLRVSMAAVAREAGVGKATLARRFASREELLTAVFADRMDGYAAAVAEALADTDPWHGFIGYIQAVAGMQAADRGFADVLTMTFPAAKALETRRATAAHGFDEVIARAKDTGHLRADFVSEDLVVLLMANAGVVAATGDAAPDTWRRLVGHLLRSYAAPGAPLPPLPDAPSPMALYRAMLRPGGGAAAAQEARRRRPSSEGDPGSAV